MQRNTASFGRHEPSQGLAELTAYSPHNARRSDAHRSRALSIILSYAALFCAGAKSLNAQATAVRDTAVLDSVFRAHRYPITLDGQRLSGEGYQFLLDASRQAQFFVVGESHYVAQIPPFSTALFATLHSTRGYNYYAVEYGPVITRMLSAPGVRGQASQGLSLARTYPHAFQFWDDEEVLAFADVSQRSTARSQPV